MATIGELIAHIGAETSDLERGAKRSQKSLQSIDKGMQTTMGIARRLTGVLGALGLGIGLGTAVRQVADFQVAMNGLAATSNATAEQMEQLESQARTLGATSKFSAQQAAEGQRFLAQAGFEVNEVLGATPGILQLATAAELDLGTAADIASNVLGGMRLEVEELNRVNDVLAATASRSNTNIQQLGQALSFAAPFAAGAGIEIEEAAAAIGVMSDAGIQASRAGTGLVGTIRQLSNVTSGGEDVLSKYGLSIEDVNIEARGLGPVLDTLRSKNLTTADAIALFGSEAGAAAQVLVNDYTGGIENATGEAERMSNQMSSGLTPAFRSLGSAISESVLQMGDSGLAGALEGLIRTSTGVISVWNGMSDQWAESNDVSRTAQTLTEGLAAALVALAAAAGARAVQAIGSLIAAKAGLTAASLTLTGALTGLRTVAATLFGPVGLIVGAGTLIYQFREELGLVPAQAKSVAENVDEITRSIDGMGDAMLDVQVAAFGAELVQIELQAERLQTRIESLQKAANDPASFGQGQQGDIRSGLTRAQAEQAELTNRAQGIEEAIGSLDRFRRSTDEVSSASGETASKLMQTNEQAGRLTDTAIKSATELAKHGESSRKATEPVDNFANAAQGAATRMAFIAQSRDPRYGFDPDEGTASSRARARFEASANRIGDPNVMNLGGNPDATRTWSTAAYDAAGSAPSMGRAANEAMQSTQQGSGKNLGTLKLASEKGGTIDVEANSDRLAGWLANTLSGNAAAS